uniref:Target of myb1 membrane trafficking protein n=1 Tax=Leptobrachium leishanense TaxID=445787 RepID=A0A8C5QN11_9ANUR
MHSQPRPIMVLRSAAMEIASMNASERGEGQEDTAGRSFSCVLIRANVLETCVKNCGHRFHVLVATQEFVEGVLVKTILPKNNPPSIVGDKVLYIIQAWADAFRSSPDLTGVVAVYEDLRRKGLEFPMTDLDTLSPIHTPQASFSRPEPAPRPDCPPPNTNQKKASVRSSAPPSYPVPAGVPASGDSPMAPTPEQLAKLRSELEVVNGNVKVMSEMLTELTPQTAKPSDMELLQELKNTCRSMQQRVVDLIPRVTHEQLIEELLIVNDNLNNVFLRQERFERMFAGKQGTAGIQNQETISPAAVFDLQAPSSAVQPPPATYPSLSSPNGSTQQVQNLSVQLAGIDVASGSVTGTLQSLGGNKKPEDEFDMFALTRGSSLADQRKSVKYEEPQAKDGLAEALDTRQQNTGAIPPTQANFMEDIEKWLAVEGGDEAEGDDGVTSEEFDKFLEERAKAADKIPSLPSPPTDLPRAASSTARNKKEQEEDSLFAL